MEPSPKKAQGSESREGARGGGEGLRSRMLGDQRGWLVVTFLKNGSAKGMSVSIGCFDK